MSKRITICIDCSDSNVDKVQKLADDMYGSVVKELDCQDLENMGDPAFDWDVAIDDVDVDLDMAYKGDLIPGLDDQIEALCNEAGGRRESGGSGWITEGRCEARDIQFKFPKGYPSTLLDDIKEACKRFNTELLYPESS